MHKQLARFTVAAVLLGIAPVSMGAVVDVLVVFELTAFANSGSPTQRLNLANQIIQSTNDALFASGVDPSHTVRLCECAALLLIVALASDPQRAHGYDAISPVPIEKNRRGRLTPESIPRLQNALEEIQEHGTRRAWVVAKSTGDELTPDSQDMINGSLDCELCSK